MDVRELAAELGLHVNSVRDQLRQLESAGRVRSAAATSAGRGRPRTLYDIDPRGDRDPNRALVLGLTDQLASSADGALIGQAAGHRWGEAEAARVPDLGAAGVEDTLTAMLAREGFAPDRKAEAGAPAASPPAVATIRLRACPYLPLNAEQLRIVCGVHLGYLEGALRGLGAVTTAASLAPFAEPDACLVRLIPTGDRENV